MDLNKVIAGLSSSGFLGGMAGGAASSVLLSKKGRKHAGTALKIGGLAALGGVAWKAYQNYQGQHRPGAVPAGEPEALEQWQGLNEAGFTVDDSDTGSTSRAMLLVHAMIAAANADGHLATSERGRIMERVGSLDLTREEKAMVFDALATPMTLAQLCAEVSCPESAAEVYLSSLLAIDRSTPDAQIYLEALSHRLNIPQTLIQQLNQQIDAK